MTPVTPTAHPLRTLPAPPQHDRILRLPEVLYRVGLSRTGLYLRAQCGEFPRPIKLGGRASGWPESEVNAWIEERKASARAGAQGQEAARA